MTTTLDIGLASEHLHGYTPHRARLFHLGRGFEILRAPSPTLVLPGDDVHFAIPISGSGSFTIDFATFGTEKAGEPAQQAGVASQPRVWFVYAASGPATVTFATVTTTYDTVVEVYVGPDPDHLELYDWNDDQGIHVNSSIDIVVGDGLSYWIRVAQKHAVTPTTDDFTWTSVDRVPTMQVTMRGGTVIPACPASLRVDVSNGDADAEITFYVDSDMGSPVGTGVLNDFGVANGLPVLLAAYGSGAHTLQVVETSGGSQTGEIDFTVTNDPATLPSPQPADVIPDVDKTTKWQLIDPAPDGETYVFTFNPESMTTPRSPRVLTIDNTTAPGTEGQAVTWEGARKATQWSWSGICQANGDIEAFDRFQALQHRVLLIDHEFNGYVLTVEGVDAQPIRDKDHPKAQTYTVSCLVYDMFTPTEAG